MLTGVMLAMIVEMGAMLAWGRLSDRIGRKPVYTIGAAGLIVMAFPFFRMLGSIRIGHPGSILRSYQERHSVMAR